LGFSWSSLATLAALCGRWQLPNCPVKCLCNCHLAGSGQERQMMACVGLLNPVGFGCPCFAETLEFGEYFQIQFAVLHKYF